MKIKELKDGMTKVTLDAKVASIDEPKNVMTKFGTEIALRNATIEDDSGSIKLTLWGTEPSVKVGDELHIEGGFVKDFRGQLQLSVGRGGKVEVK